MKATVYNQQGKEVGETVLPEKIFGLEASPDLIHQVVVSQQGNSRQVLAHTKDRSEVSGGGKKPWRQKGTGRARHGSSRSPLWRHGGITFGPRNEKNFKRAIPDKMRQKSVLMVLSDKAKNNLVIVLDALKLEQPKTKLMQDVLNHLPINSQTAVLTVPATESNLLLSARNIPELKITPVKDLNTLDLLSFKYVILPQESIKALEDIFIKGKEAPSAKPAKAEKVSKPAKKVSKKVVSKKVAKKKSAK